MKFTCVETIVRYKTIEVDETELGIDPEEKYYDFDQDVQDDIREEMFKRTADDGWDVEYCLDSTIEVGEHEPVLYHAPV